jgi:signal transduction histidine kinase
MMIRRRAVRLTKGLALGAATALVELGFVLFSAPLLAVPAARPAVFGRAKGLMRLEKRRLGTYLRLYVIEDFPEWRIWRYMAVRWAVGVLGAAILLLMVAGVAVGGIMAWQLVSGQPLGGGAGPMSWYDPVVFVLGGVLMAFLVGQGLAGVAALDCRVASRLLVPDASLKLLQRIQQLTLTRAAVMDAVNEERRRIERDLHDGVQQRLVALGVLLGRARRAEDEQHAGELVRQAHEESQHALDDLREVTWRVYPIALEQAGLHTALEGLAERSCVPVQLRYELAERADIALETVAYFVASEAVTNTIKHANASGIEISVHRREHTIVVMIRDDGRGGAEVYEGGLFGLHRRVAAVDGQFTVDSPVGGPTLVTAELPCG